MEIQQKQDIQWDTDSTSENEGRAYLQKQIKHFASEQHNNMTH